MKRKELLGFFGCFVLLLFVSAAWAAPIPDTGQTKCYDVAGNEITCRSPGEALYGQDADYSINPMSYTKLDGSGNVLVDDAPYWVMVRDNVTGLIWEMKNSKDGVKNYNDPHDADNTYTWYDSNPATNGGDPGAPGDGTDTEDFIKALNDAHYGGYIDWRLPTINELAYVVNYNIPWPGPVINTNYFPNTQAGLNWSSTTNAGGTGYAWGMAFNNGSVNGLNGKTGSNYVRAVRGGQSGLFGFSDYLVISPEASTVSEHYVDNNDDTVTDKTKGLMWQQKTPVNTMTWEQAMSYCENSTLAGYTNWRLPTHKELRSLVDYSRYYLPINTTFFPDTVSSLYLSSTTYALNTGSAWSVGFNYGYDFFYGKDGMGVDHFVRAVRGGQAMLLGHLIILSPNQADNWDIGSQRVITWNTQSIAGNVKISISRDGGKNYTSIADSVPNNGSYPWTVAGPASVNCMMKIEPLSDLTKGTVQGLFTLSATPSFDIGLTGPGWNLISLPLQPSDTAISTVLGGISGKYASAWAFQNDAWKAFDPANPGFSDLSTMEAGWGYWLNMTQAATLSVAGAEPSKTMNLITGWNLIGYNSTASQNITDALASIAGKVISVWAYKNNAWQLYDPANPGFSDLTTLATGYGYWINTNGACTWTLP